MIERFRKFANHHSVSVVLAVIGALLILAIVVYVSLVKAFPDFPPETLPLGDGPPSSEQLAMAHAAYIAARSAQFGQMGDTIGGLLNPFLTIVSTLGLVGTIAVAAMQLTDARAAAADQLRLGAAQLKAARRIAREERAAAEVQRVETAKAAVQQLRLGAAQLKESQRTARAERVAAEKKLAENREATKKQHELDRLATRVAALTALLQSNSIEIQRVRDSTGPGVQPALQELTRKQGELLELLTIAHNSLHKVDAQDIPLPPTMQREEEQRQRRWATEEH